MAHERVGRLLTESGRPTIQFERQLPHPVARVWRAISESEDLARWFPADLQGERSIGEAVRIVSFTGRFPAADGRFTAYEPERVLEYTWGDEILRWRLHATPTGTLLVFTNVMDGQAAALGAADVAAAWHACLDLLDFVLAGETAPYSADDRFIQVRPLYGETDN